MGHVEPSIEIKGMYNIKYDRLLNFYQVFSLHHFPNHEFPASSLRNNVGFHAMQGEETWGRGFGSWVGHWLHLFVVMALLQLWVTTSLFLGFFTRIGIPISQSKKVKRVNFQFKMQRNKRCGLKLVLMLFYYYKLFLLCHKPSIHEILDLNGRCEHEF